MGNKFIVYNYNNDILTKKRTLNSAISYCVECAEIYSIVDDRIVWTTDDIV